jgi:hypothetical protein
VACRRNCRVCSSCVVVETRVYQSPLDTTGSRQAITQKKSRFILGRCERYSSTKNFPNDRFRAWFNGFAFFPPLSVYLPYSIWQLEAQCNKESCKFNIVIFLQVFLKIQIGKHVQSCQLFSFRPSIASSTGIAGTRNDLTGLLRWRLKRAINVLWFTVLEFQPNRFRVDTKHNNNASPNHFRVCSRTWAAHRGAFQCVRFEPRVSDLADPDGINVQESHSGSTHLPAPK